MQDDGWIGFDLDGTLADSGDNGTIDAPGGPIDIIGAPIVPMIDELLRLYNQGIGIKICTARVATENLDRRALQVYLIQRWCIDNLGMLLPITCQKDFNMILLYDDRCVCVERDTGIVIGKPSYVSKRGKQINI